MAELRADAAIPGAGVNMDPFHPGERLVQTRAGVMLQGAPIRPFMPEQHWAFFAGLPVLFVGVADRNGAPLATALAGPPGFVASPGPTRLQIAAAVHAHDPAGPALRPGAEIGLLGIEFATRRRNRANGVVLRSGADLEVEVRQSFGNCPKYIHSRTVEVAAWTPGPVQRMAGLDGAARALIEAADTFFVASSSGSGGGVQGGVDMSHRAGPAGFVTVEGDRLLVPDYRGNRYFNTLGNLVLNPRAALLFVDWASGGVLSLQGGAALVWGEAGVAAWSVDVEAGWYCPHALPLRWAGAGA